MKRIPKKYISIFLLLSCFGCNKNLLNTVPNDRITSQIFWSKDNDALIAANALYTFLDSTNRLQRDVFSDLAHTNTEFGDYKAIEVGAYNATIPVIEAE